MQSIQTRRLDYPDHAEEIASLNFILAEIQQSGTRPELAEVIAHVLSRLDQLMTLSKARVSIYNQFEDRR